MFCTVLGLYDTVFDVDNDKERAQAQGVEHCWCWLCSQQESCQIWYKTLIVEMEILDGIINVFAFLRSCHQKQESSMVSHFVHRKFDKWDGHARVIVGGRIMNPYQFACSAWLKMLKGFNWFHWQDRSDNSGLVSVVHCEAFKLYPYWYLCSHIYDKQFALHVTEIWQMRRYTPFIPY